MPSGAGRSSFDDEDSVEAPLLPLQPIHNDEQGPRSSDPNSRHRRSVSRTPSFLGKLLQYTPLHNPPHSRKSARRRAAQCCSILIAVPVALLVSAVLCWGGIPRSYASIRRLERNLPQHRWHQVKVDSSGELVQRQGHGKFDWAADAGEGYLRFPNHLWGHGFNNILEESCVLS